MRLSDVPSSRTHEFRGRAARPDPHAIPLLKSESHHAPPLRAYFSIFEAEESLAQSRSSRGEPSPRVVSIEHRGIEGLVFGSGDRAAPSGQVEGDEGCLEILSSDLHCHSVFEVPDDPAERP